MNGVHGAEGSGGVHGQAQASGAPQPDEQHAGPACRAAHHMHEQASRPSCSPSSEYSGHDGQGGSGCSSRDGDEDCLHDRMEEDGYTSSSDDDVLGGVSPEEMEEIESLQPGHDGSVAVRRAEFEAYEMPTLQEDQQCWLREYLMHWLHTYAAHGITQAGVTHVLRGEKAPVGGRAMWQRSALPSSFKSMLNALKQLGTGIEQFTFDYDMCRCGFLYR